MPITPEEINAANIANMEQEIKRMKPIPAPTASRGAWVTLHMLPTVGETKTVLGYMTGAESGMLKLTKFVTEAYAVDAHQGEGQETYVHDGVWLINPAQVWMIEHEKHIPESKFRPYSDYPHLRM